MALPLPPEGSRRRGPREIPSGLGNSVGDKDAIVLCICAEASFWSAALERPHSAKIISNRLTHWKDECLSATKASENSCVISSILRQAYLARDRLTHCEH